MNSIKKKFNKIFNFDKWFVKFLNSRKDVSHVVTDELKKIPLLFGASFIIPPPGGTILMLPVFAWYSFAPTPRMKAFRSKIKNAFNKDIDHQRLKEAFTDKNGKAKFSSIRGMKMLAKELYAEGKDNIKSGWKYLKSGKVKGDLKKAFSNAALDTRKKTNGGLNFIRKKIGLKPKVRFQ